MAIWKKSFSFNELVSNNDGKSSGSGFIGVYLGIIGGVAFLAGMGGYFIQIPNTVDVLGKVMELIFAVTILLGVRKVGAVISAGKNNSSTEESTVSTTTSTTTSQPKDPIIPIDTSTDTTDISNTPG